MLRYYLSACTIVLVACTMRVIDSSAAFRRRPSPRHNVASTFATQVERRSRRTLCRMESEARCCTVCSLHDAVTAAEVGPSAQATWGTKAKPSAEATRAHGHQTCMLSMRERAHSCAMTSRILGLVSRPISTPALLRLGDPSAILATDGAAPTTSLKYSVRQQGDPSTHSHN